MRLSEFMDMGGEVFAVRRGDEMFRAMGVRTHDKREILFETRTDVRPGDWLEADSGNKFYVLDADVQVVEQQPFARRISYQTDQTAMEYQVAQESARPQATTFNIFGPSYGFVIGSEPHAQVTHPTFTFGDLERDIDRLGGEDAEDLKAMVRDLRSTLENQDSLSRGKLSHYSELLNRTGTAGSRDR